MAEPTLFDCCKHCPEDDPAFHAEYGLNAHETSCITCDNEEAAKAFQKEYLNRDAFTGDLEEPHSDALIGSVKDALLAVDHEWFTDIHYHTGLAEELALAAIKAVRAYDEEHHG